MTKPQIQELARFGAEARLNALQEEQAALLAMFPELRGERRGRKPSNGSAPKAAPPARKRKRMSAAQRKAVGARMKAYWAAKRAEKAGEGGQAEAGNGATSRKSGRKSGRKQGRKK